MKTTQLSGFVIKYHSFMEANKIVTIFSKEKGKINIVAHGIRKTKSKHGSAFELLNEVKLILNKPNNNTKLFSIKEASIILSVHKLKENYSNINILYYIAEFISTFVQENHSDTEIYTLLKQTITEAIKQINKLYTIVRAFELKAISIFGFLPNLKHCSNCNSILIKKEKEIKPFSKPHYDKYHLNSIFVSQRAGWLFCHKCKNTYTDKKITLDTYKTLIKLNNYCINQIHKIEMNNNTRTEINYSFEKLINSIIGKKLNNPKLIY